MKGKLILKLVVCVSLTLNLLGCVSLNNKSLIGPHVLTASKLKDNSGLIYVGYKIDKSLIANYLDEMREKLGDKEFKTYRTAQAERDHDSFHITLINPYEYDDIKNIEMSKLPQATFLFKGLGRASNDKDSAIFVVVSSQAAQQFRKNLGLNNKDFHITLGFNRNDVFGVSKNDSTLFEK